MPLLFALLPFFSTLLGGLAALRLRHRLHPVMAFAAGVLVATALANLLPEATVQVVGAWGEGSAGLVGVASVAGFLVFTGLEAFVHRQTWEHQHNPAEDPHSADHEHAPVTLGLLAPMGIVVHSLLDGVAIGTGFRTDLQLGLLVAFAVLAHDFADGMNVVTLAFRWGSGKRAALAVLALDAVAPVLGAAIGTLVPLDAGALGLLLAGFAGVFIAIGAGHLLPEAQHGRSGGPPWLLALTVAGAGLVLVVRALLGE